MSFSEKSLFPSPRNDGYGSSSPGWTLNAQESVAIDAVALGYVNAAAPYREQKDASLLELALFQVWIQTLSKPGLSGPVVDLGCASGYPVAGMIASCVCGCVYLWMLLICL